MNDTTRRFLNAVLERVTESRIVELRLFPAIRQGGIESGIAVLAVEPEPELPATVEPVEMTNLVEDLPEIEAALTDEIEVAIQHPADVEFESTAGVEIDAELLHRVSESHAAHDDVEAAEDDASDRETTLEVSTEGIVDLEVTLESDEGEAEVERAPAMLADDASMEEPEETIALGDILSLPAPDAASAHTNTPKRLEILCARYKLIFKGPERGKWDLEIMHQADAPLDTLDRVISGVVRRAGEDSEPERFSRESLRSSLDAPAWAHSA